MFKKIFWYGKCKDSFKSHNNKQEKKEKEKLNITKLLSYTLYKASFVIYRFMIQG